ncbi:hypothetical protein GPECTOR_26g515 [Gonium pectorale]|uniref:Uncharacterized protein n=1 Tax=Gonium pectorale TaxID=33097 RepID=A0A150GFJ0_GONPE|nr:hypothetical protein GPECTOR_26g515 [Gonium pectorale]|eukprot:KXZ48612.1 hypothetical protein GPECTOR_26g515 [Gonium pectorale]
MPSNPLPHPAILPSTVIDSFPALPPRRSSSAPLQLGPLPLALVEEIMRASGRQLGPDGTSAALSIASTVPGSSGRGAGQQHQQLRHDASSSTGGAGGGGSGGAAAPLPAGMRASGAAAGAGSAGAAAPVAAAKRAAAGRLGGAGGGGADDGVCSLALSRSPIDAPGMRPAPGPSPRPPAAPAGAAAAGGHAVSSGGAADAVRGFRRTTYSRTPDGVTGAAAAGAAASAGSAAGAAGGQQAGVSSGGCGCETRSEASPAALRSHPLDPSDWGSDCENDSQAAAVVAAAVQRSGSSLVAMDGDGGGQDEGSLLFELD